MSDTEVKIGARGMVAHLVEERHCTRRGEHKIFSTPNMVQLLENAAIETLRPLLREGQVSVGTNVEVRHLAPTPMGLQVRAEATVREVDGSRILFDIEVFDSMEKVGSAVHERYILDLDRYMRRLEKKIAGAQATKGK